MSEMPDEPPPVLGNWTNVYIFVLIYLASVITVFYDPTDPSESVLEPGPTTLVWASIAGGLVFVVLGVVLATSAT